MFGFLKGRRTQATTSSGEKTADAAPVAQGLDLTLLVPLIKVVELDDPSTAVLTLSHDDSPVTRPFAADLIVMYAVDLPTHFQFVSYGDLKNASMTQEELHSLALRNLPTRVPKIELHGQPSRYMVTAGGNLEATLLLLDSMWEQFEEQMPGELLAVAPARDLLFVSASGWDGALSFMQEMASRDLPEKRYALSKCVFARRGGIWVPHALAG
ncbi:DUF1444 family protein [Variovorax sp. VRV01]|uniref:DUF1444 family protein n=1 Tax=Variovorax sp. VRV01 TaxID=2769259 RepID=UPI0017832125|nr:DUF1444 family protein [Variovorax sp. VRV01]MBD9668012.1 DUF1444 family protein [Variovorax sp. VRV01]